jgi:phosphoglycolate phosphatase
VRLREQIALHGLEKEFDLVAGTGDDYADGKAGAAKRCIADLGADPGAVVFVGDTDHDLEVARHTGARCVLLTGGNQNDDRLLALGVPVLEDVRELPEYL